MGQTTIEYRVVVERAGIKSTDHYFNLDRAVQRMDALGTNPKNKVRIQAREVTEWKVIIGDHVGRALVDLVSADIPSNFGPGD